MIKLNLRNNYLTLSLLILSVACGEPVKKTIEETLGKEFALSVFPRLISLNLINEQDNYYQLDLTFENEIQKTSR